MTASSIRGRSAPRSSRARVSSRSTPSSASAATTSAVSPFAPLAMANRVAGVAGRPWARSARPKPRSNGGSPARSTRTTPEKPDAAAAASTARASASMAPESTCRRVRREVVAAALRWRGRVGSPSGPASIGAPRFELGTSPTRTVRATRLRHAPERAILASVGAAAGRGRRGGSPGRERPCRAGAGRGPARRDARGRRRRRELGVESAAPDVDARANSARTVDEPNNPAG